MCYVLCLLVIMAIISGCSSNVKLATTKEIVSNFQKDTNSVVKQFSTVVFAEGSKDIGKELNAEIKTYKRKYYKNPNLTDKESVISNTFVDAVDKYNKSQERKDDKFNADSSFSDYVDVVTVLGELQKFGFEVNASMK